jgi:hypothetical protein
MTTLTTLFVVSVGSVLSVTYVPVEVEVNMPKLIARLALDLANRLLGCKHESVAWPQSGEQACLDCGARRDYTLGETPGRWRG